MHLTTRNYGTMQKECNERPASQHQNIWQMYCAEKLVNLSKVCTLVNTGKNTQWVLTSGNAGQWGVGPA